LPQVSQGRGVEREDRYAYLDTNGKLDTVALGSSDVPQAMSPLSLADGVSLPPIWHCLSGLRS
jgi:hypothetical protein